MDAEPGTEDWLPSADLETYRIVIENAPAMLWLGDATGKCVFLNAAQRAFWGVSDADFATFDWSGTVHPDDLGTLFDPFSRAMAAQEPFSVEAR